MGHRAWQALNTWKGGENGGLGSTRKQGRPLDTPSLLLTGNGSVGLVHGHKHLCSARHGLQDIVAHGISVTLTEPTSPAAPQLRVSQHRLLPCSLAVPG